MKAAVDIVRMIHHGDVYSRDSLSRSMGMSAMTTSPVPSSALCTRPPPRRTRAVPTILERATSRSGMPRPGCNPLRRETRRRPKSPWEHASTFLREDDRPTGPTRHAERLTSTALTVEPTTSLTDPDTTRFRMMAHHSPIRYHLRIDGIRIRARIATGLGEKIR